MDAPRRLLRDSKWISYYLVEPDGYVEESKLAKGQVSITAAEFKDQWLGMPDAEKLDFVNAFVQKQTLTEDDEAIIRFVMEVGPEFVWSTLIYALLAYSDRPKATAFVLAHLAACPSHSIPSYQVLALMSASEAIPVLEQHYQAYQQELSPLEKYGFDDLGQYISCCSALRILTGSPEYEQALRDLLGHPDERVPRLAKLHLARPRIDKLGLGASGPVSAFP